MDDEPTIIRDRRVREEAIEIVAKALQLRLGYLPSVEAEASRADARMMIEVVEEALRYEAQSRH